MTERTFETPLLQIKYRWGFDVLTLAWTNFLTPYIHVTWGVERFLIGFGFWRWIFSFGQQMQIDDGDLHATLTHSWKLGKAFVSSAGSWR